ncbi:MAG: CpaF family protein [Agromyces sp.]
MLNPAVQPGPNEVATDPFGALASLLELPGITDLVVNGPEVWFDRGNGLERFGAPLGEPTETLIRRLISAGGRHIDEVTPIADVQVGDFRVHAVLPPIARSGPALSIRKHRSAPRTLDELCDSGTFSNTIRNRLRCAVADGERILISGSTGAGKTTVLRALLAEVRPELRIVSIEDVGELRLPGRHLVQLETRQPNIEGMGAIGMSELIRAALRMRPDWLVVGECRGAEIGLFLSALNTGHAGAGTIHANALDAVPARLESLGALAHIPTADLARQVASAFDLVVHLEQRSGRRRCTGIARFLITAGRLSCELETRDACE